MIKRPRRLRGSEQIRKMVRETRMDKSSLVYPVFVMDGDNIEKEIPSIPGQYHYSVDRLPYELERLQKAGITNLMLFGIPSVKDETGSRAYAEDGVVQRALREGKKRFPDLYYITDVCMCEYTSHGHCGILRDGKVDNDPTLAQLSKIALSHAEAGADMVAPSDMMDGRILAIREHLDKNGYQELPIMSYAAKYASASFGSFRDAAGGIPTEVDRSGYQMDYHNKKEAIKEVLLDADEGADIVMVKPAGFYLDIIAAVADATDLPVATFSTSGEYCMVKAGAQKGYVDEEETFCEMAVSAYRAGADIYITYYAKELAKCMDEGRIG